MLASIQLLICTHLGALYLLLILTSPHGAELIADQIKGSPVLILTMAVGLGLIMCLMRVLDHVGMVMTLAVGYTQITI